MEASLHTDADKYQAGMGITGSSNVYGWLLILEAHLDRQDRSLSLERLTSDLKQKG
jgi:hypothetical protein